MSTSNIIQANSLTFTYAKASQPAIQEIDFSIKTGEIFGLLGPSGAGKSTTQKILIGLLKGYKGIVKVFGKDLTDWKSDLYERIGVSFELPNHFLKLTAMENLTYFSALYKQKKSDPQNLLDMVGLGEDGNIPVGQFSKGMKHRLNFARAFVNDPDLLFLDEPTAGLDPGNARRIKDLIQAGKEAGKTIFLTTHNMSVADELCNRVGFIVDGKISLIDTPRSLKIRFGQPTVRVEFVDQGKVANQDFKLNGLGDDLEFIRLLKNGGVQTIHTQEASLDEIFIEITGRRLQ
jgi:fluoroquinolone transport system ATP-binding protein